MWLGSWTRDQREDSEDFTGTGKAVEYLRLPSASDPPTLSLYPCLLYLLHYFLRALIPQWRPIFLGGIGGWMEARISMPKSPESLLAELLVRVRFLRIIMLSVG